VLLSKSQRLWLKPKLLKVQESFVRAFLSYGDEELLRALRSLGIRPSDSVMLHSAFQRKHGYCGSIEQLTNVFIEAVGPDGHLLMVSLPYRSSSLEYLERQRVFDVLKTPSMMGLVSEMFRRRPDVLRSLHPTHPVLVRGPKAEWFVADHPGCRFPCGPGSPFERLAQVDGQAVFFNALFANFTFFHYLEHLVSGSLPFPLYTAEPIEARVVDRDRRERTVATYVFAAEAIRRRRFEILERELRRRGAIRSRRLGATRLEAVRVRDSIACVQDMARRGVYFYEASAPPPAAAALLPASHTRP
jgi:aminoglycoside 3-N-acetyltransferase